MERIDEQSAVEFFEERAAIFEFDAGLSRVEAQRRAYWDWRKENEGVPTPQRIQDWAIEYKKQRANKAGGADSRPGDTDHEATASRSDGD
jgi:hypothetical protein